MGEINPADGDRKIHKVVAKESGQLEGYMIWCEACEQCHVFDARWTYNGDIDKPTFTPSLLVTHPNGELRCHSFVTDGKIKYLPDCSHAMAGQTVELQLF